MLKSNVFAEYHSYFFQHSTCNRFVSGCGLNQAWQRPDVIEERVLRRNVLNNGVAAGCSNVPSGSVGIFRFPKDKALMSKWEKQVQKTTDGLKVTEHSYLCNE